MMDFESGERVVCVSDKKSCCGTKIESSSAPKVGEVYTVKQMGFGVCSICLKPSIAIQTEATRPGCAWPQDCFKKLPPKITVKDKKVQTPVLTDAWK